MRAQDGFTLIEVLVALAVLAISLGAIIQSIGNSASHAGYLREKTVAHWVAMNQIAEAQSNNKAPSAGATSGKEEMAGHEWHWRMVTTEVDKENMPGVFQLQVEVRTNRNDKKALSTLIGLVGLPE